MIRIQTCLTYETRLPSVGGVTHALIMDIVVGSLNPLKIGSVHDAAVEMIIPPWQVQGVNVASGVSRQPWGDEETLHGAESRAERAWDAWPDAAIAVGIEAGLVAKAEGRVESMSWVVALGRTANGTIARGESRTASYLLPVQLATLVLAGTSLGEATDVVFSGTGLSRTVGTVGPLTGGAIDRREHYRVAVTLALIPFRVGNAELFLSR